MSRPPSIFNADDVNASTAHARQAALDDAWAAVRDLWPRNGREPVGDLGDALRAIESLGARSRIPLTTPNGDEK